MSGRIDSRDLAAIRSATAGLLELLAAGEFEQFLMRCASTRLSVVDIETVLREYPATAVTPPDEAYEYLDVFRVNSPSNTWSVWMPLWTKEEGRSDLTLQLTITLHGDEASIEFDNFRVP